MVISGDEWGNCFQHLPGDIDFAAKGQTFSFRVVAIEASDGLGPQRNTGIIGCPGRFPEGIRCRFQARITHDVTVQC
ncbi:MAG: hypothetical protein U9R58_04755 [Chloroflexota bacterium]|nr:hypothetical protein [Chloroflexota bacterium]